MLRLILASVLLLCSIASFSTNSLSGPCFDGVTISVIDETCGFDFNYDGEIKASPFSSLHPPPYNFAWSDGQMGSRAIALQAGTYSVTITEKTHGCDTIISGIVVGAEPDTTKPDCFSQNINISLDTSGQQTIVASAIDGGSSDDCSPYVNYSASQTVFTCADLPSQLVTLTVTDAAGNSNNCTATVNILDKSSACSSCTNPTISITETKATCPNSSDGALEAIVTGSSTYSYQWSPAAAGQTTSKATGLTAGNYAVTVTDESDPSCSVVGFESVDDADNTPPVITCNGKITVELCAIDSFQLPLPSATDECGIDEVDILAVLDVSSSDTCPVLDDIIIIFYATDSSGNTDTCHQRICIIDTTPPNLIIPGDTMIMCSDDTSVAALGMASVQLCYDTSQGQPILEKITYQDIVIDTLIYRIWTATDSCGNMVSDTQKIMLKSCPVDCEVSPWGPWSACSESCGDGIQTRTRTVTVQPKNGGAACPNLTEQQSCNNGPCFTPDNVLICPPDTTLKAASGKCDVFVGGLLATDTFTTTNDTITHVTSNGLSGGADASRKYPVGTTTIVFYYENFDSGEKDTCQTTVTVLDNQSPFVFCIQNVAAPLDPNSGEVEIVVPAVVSSTSDNCGIDTVYFSKSKFDCSDVGLVSVTVTAVDPSGNMNTCVTQIDVQDNTDPEALCAFVSAYIDSNGIAIVDASMFDGGSTDNCSIDSIEINRDTLTCDDISGLGPNVILTVYDPSGNSDTCHRYVWLADTLAPKVVCQDICVYLDSAGQVTVTAADIDNGSSDNCDKIFLALEFGNFTSSVDTTFGCGSIDTQVVDLKLIVIDDYLNIDSCYAKVTIKDTILPSVTCDTATLTLAETGFVDLTNLQAIEAMSNFWDNCQLAIQVKTDNIGCNDTLTKVTIVVSNISATGFVPVDSCVSNVMVQDTTPPIASCKDTCVYLDSNGVASLLPADINDGSSDNCSIDTMYLSKSKFSCSDQSSAIGYTANTDTGHQSFTGSLTNDFIVKSPIQITQLGAFDHLSDGIQGSIQVAVIELSSGNIVPGLDVTITGSGDPLIEGHRMRNVAAVTLQPDTYTIAALGFDNIDRNGNVNTNDPYLSFNSSPEIMMGPKSRWGFNTTDITVLTNMIAPGYFHAGTFTYAVKSVSVELVVEDNSGNESTCSAIVTIKDTIDLVLTCPGDTVIANDSGQCSAIYNYNVTAWDNCAVDIEQIDGLISGDTFDVGTDTVTYLATDACGQTAECSFTVTVEDKEGPVLECPSDTTVYRYFDGACFVTYTIVDSATDNCDILFSTTFTVISSNDTTTLTITRFDNSGNSTTCSATIIGLDTISPVISCPANYSVFNDDSCSITLDSADFTTLPTATDNCDYTISQISGTSIGSSFSTGTHELTFAATDDFGNADTCSFFVEILDTVPPMAVCKDDTIYLDSTGEAGLTADDIDGGSTDNCDLILSFASDTLVDSTAFSCNDHLGFYQFFSPPPTDRMEMLKLYASDPSGNIDSCEAKVTILDTIPPELECSDTTLYLNDTGSAALNAGDLYSVSDACGLGHISIIKKIYDCDDLGLNLIQIIISDVNNNTSTCKINVMIEDTLAPVAVCRDTFDVYIDTLVKLPPQLFDGGSSTNCGSISFSADRFLFTCADIGVNEVVLTVTDDDGREDSCSAYVNIIDLNKPVAKCKSQVKAFVDANGIVVITPAILDDGSLDECGGPLTYSFSPASLACASNFVTMTVTDESGNSASCGGTVLVNDTIAPEVVCQDIKVNLQPSGVQTITMSDVLVSLSDNCQVNSTQISQTIYACPDLGANTETITVTDNSGNTTICTYTVTVNDPHGVCVPTCATPVNLMTFNVTYSTASGKWNAVPNAVNYIIQGNRVGAPTVAFSTTDTFYSVAGLRQATDYEWSVIAVCQGNVTSAASQMMTFTTDLCEKPVNLSVSDLTPVSATLHWDNVPEAVSYRVKGGPVGGTQSTFNVSADSFNATGLIPGTTYRWIVRSICSNSPLIVSAISDIDTFTTPIIPKLSEGEHAGKYVSVYPNPNDGMFILELFDLEEDGIIELFDLLGKRVLFEEFAGTSGKQKFEMNMQHKPSGTYLMQVTSGNERRILKVVIHE